MRSIEHPLNSDLIDNIGKYLQLLHGDSFNDELHEILGIKNIVKMLNLKDDEKLRFMKITDAQRQNDFLLRKTRYMTILLEQERKVDQNFYLN